jgi:UDP-N-acetylmuramyl tripeptide synthase
MARRVSPEVLKQLAQQAKCGVLAVTGTNGKSTTSGLLSSILRTAGFTLVHNRQGANLVTGITASLVDAAKWDGTIDADYCLFEIDEAALPLIASEVKISTVLVTNLFRDQLDRFGELDTTAKLIASGIAKNSSNSVLNADDPNVSQLAPDTARLFFGVEDVVSVAAANGSGSTGAATKNGAGKNGDQEILSTSNANDKELSSCSKCGSEIDYDLFFYGQLGHWHCTKCQVKRPTPTVVASSVHVHTESSTFKLSIGNRCSEVTVPLPGLFNVYNALAAAAAASHLGVSIEAIRQGLKSYKTLFGRSEKITVHGKHVLIQLIKNPAGASQAIRAVTSDKNARILIAINDNLADGRDISWLWDADFEQLAWHEKKLVVSGQRAEDMAVRMKYCGIKSENIVMNAKLDKALDQALNMVQPGETLWVLPTYTCLLELQKILKARGLNLSET